MKREDEDEGLVGVGRNDETENDETTTEEKPDV